MFFHLFHYRLKTLLKNHVLLFWTCAFPLLLGCFFNIAFSGLDDLDAAEQSKVAVVADDSERSALFSEILTQLKSGDRQLFEPVTVSKTEAAEMLQKNKVSGVYTVTSSAISLKIAKGDIPQTILRSYLNQYLQNEKQNRILAEAGASPSGEWLQEVVQTDHVKESARSKKSSEKSFYFFTLIGMACTYGFYWGIRNSQDEQAGKTPNGIRLSLIPHNKLLVMIANFCAAFTLLFLEILFILAFVRFIYQVDFGDRWQYIILTCALGSLNALVFGSFISNRSKSSGPQMEGLALSLTMIMSALAGMMGTTNLKYAIDQHVPLLAKINPVNLISESLYQLYYYDSLAPYFMNLLYLLLMTIFFTIFGFLLERRAQYDHL